MNPKNILWGHFDQRKYGCKNIKTEGDRHSLTCSIKKGRNAVFCCSQRSGPEGTKMNKTRSLPLNNVQSRGYCKAPNEGITKCQAAQSKPGGISAEGCDQELIARRVSQPSFTFCLPPTSYQPNTVTLFKTCLLGRRGRGRGKKERCRPEKQYLLKRYRRNENARVLRRGGWSDRAPVT